MSKPASSLADVQSLAARCIEMADPQLDADFEATFGQAPAVFAALPAQAQQAHLQSHAETELRVAQEYPGFGQDDVQAVAGLRSSLLGQADRQGNVAELAKYVADFESGVIASRGAINDASFDQKRLAASKEAIASGSDHDVKECLNWWAEAIASGSLVQGQGNVATSKDHPDAFFDAQGKLFDWETGDPMPQGWTGIAKRKDTLFVIGQDGEETSYTALYAKTMVDALKEAAARNLLGVQGNVREEANGNAWLDSNVAYRLAAIRGGRDTPYSGKIMLDDRVVGNWFINTERERGAANGMFVKPEFREAFAKWAREKLDFTDALKLCGCDESSLNDPLAVTFLAGQTLSSETVLQIMQALKVERLDDKSADGSPSLGM